MTTELSPKRLELLKEAVPKASRVMFLQDPEAAPNALKLTQEVAPRLGIRLQVANVGVPEQLLPELTMIAKERPDALFVYPDVVLSSQPRPQQLADFALKAHLPTMHAFRFFVDAGGLMSYGATQSEIYRTRDFVLRATKIVLIDSPRWVRSKRPKAELEKTQTRPSAPRTWVDLAANIAYR